MSGPGPAIAAKWWPNSTQRDVGRKLCPSRFVCAGVARSSLSTMTFAARNAL